MTSASLVEISGQIERITFTNEENGFTIAKVKVYGYPDLVSAVGKFASPVPGETVELQGEWVHHPKFGEQFRVVHYKSKVPASVNGIRKYLGSGLIKGIGPKIAERIVGYFGKATLDIIETDTDKLTQIDGIGPHRISMIKQAWEEQREIRDVMLFLQSHGVHSGYAVKIFRHYGKDSIAIVQENPYRLATDIWGIGFVTADRIAEKLGFAKESAFRAQAGILYVLHGLGDDGHVCYPHDALIEKCRELLEIPSDLVDTSLKTIAEEHRVVIETGKDQISYVFLEKFHVCESLIAIRIHRLLQIPKHLRAIQTDAAIQWVQKQIGIELAENQVTAVRCAIENKVMVITGGPGTGKTTIIAAVIQIFSRLNARILLAAPTGRAARRMSEATGHEAKTIHRLLSYSFKKGGFQKDDKNPLECDVLIVDEASMLDTVLMHHLLKAVPPEATLILVGDIHQLPSVGAGAVLSDIIASNMIPVVSLNEIFRQARTSQIIVNAHRINHGQMPFLKSGDPPSSDFYFIEQEDPDKVLNTILRLVTDRIPARFGLDPINDIQVLTPMHRGTVGAGNLNIALQKALNPGQEGIVRGGRTFCVHDKVMQIRNDYDREVFNGDIGRILSINPDEQKVCIHFDGREVYYEYADLDEITLAYAVSVHKSQGSEYPAIILPMLTQHYMLLQRNLIYTAVTRGRKLVVMVGASKALRIGVHNNKTEKRFTLLKERLAKAALE